MKIVHALSTINKTGTFYGVESHALSLTIMQKARGHDLMVATNQHGYFTEACAKHNIPAIIEPILAPAAERGDRPDDRAIATLASHFSDFGAELVHGHSPSAAAQAFSAASKINRPCVFTLHAADRFVVKRFKQHKFSVIAVSKSHYEELKKMGFRSEDDLYFVPNGTSVIPREPGQPAESRRPGLMLVGNLNFTKGIDIALATMSVLRQRRGQDCPVLNIYGDTSDDEIERYLREFAVALGLADLVFFHGNQPGILQTCPASDILLVPSRAETGPLVVLEAMSRGMPVVAAKVGQVTDMLPDERYGRIVPTNSILVLADAIEATLADVASGRFDPELTITRHRNLFTDEIMVDRTEEVYERILQKESLAG